MIRSGDWPVRGELWQVEDDAFARLDEFEDVRLFSRRKIEMEGVPKPVFVYLYQGDISRLADCGDSWPSFP